MFVSWSFSASGEAVGRLDHHDVLAVAGHQVEQVGLQVTQRPVPVDVLRDGDDVEGDAARDGVVEPPDVPAVVAALGQVQHHLGRRRRRPHGRAAGLEQRGQPVPVVPPAVGPEHATVDFVAYLGHVGRGVLCAQRGDDRIRVVVEGLRQLVEGQACPGGRLVLLARVGPGVGVVEVDQQLHAQGLGRAWPSSGCRPARGSRRPSPPTP